MVDAITLRTALPSTCQVETCLWAVSYNLINVPSGSVNEMEFILDDEILVDTSSGRWRYSTVARPDRRMKNPVLHFRRTEAMPRAVTVHVPKYICVLPFQGICATCPPLQSE